MIKGLLVSILLLLSGGAAAQEVFDALLEAIKSETPEQLPYYIDVSENCPFTEEKAESMLEGVFIRSRIKPDSSGWNYAPVYLDVVVQCVLLENNIVYNISAKFARYRPRPAITFAHDNGVLGINPDGDDIFQDLKGLVEDAITLYIKANFDQLGR